MATDFDPDWLVGLTEAAAKDACRTAGRPVRVLTRNGNALVVTRDWVPERINLTVADRLVTEVSTG